MNLLIDTNLLVRLEDTLDARHPEAMSAIERLKRDGHDGQLVPQVLYEFWVVATRPVENNGLGLDPPKAEDAMRGWVSLFRFRLDERGIFRNWMQLVAAHQVRGKTAHDARLVAAMQRHGLTDILTFNSADFTRFSGLHVFTPADVLAGGLPA
ncbi:MAG: type II toxin-antitoxin system VapC family toxin [Planctomycetaceae bacterium]|nr:type II toxin-antitoxin system VapC family toxin [Planctomycetaceae bacterium]